MTQKYKEQYRPQFHFTPEKSWMNDPNGMVFFNDEYHLFYQYYPNDTVWGPMHWGHAVSRDMVHWEHLPIGLYPDEHGMIFSGSAVVDWNNTTGFFEDGKPGLVAIFTNHDKYPDSDRDRQRQSLAYSKDNGRTWVKYEGNPVLSDENITDYRDPKVFWHHETEKWVMVLATGQSATLYTSSNLKEWEFASEFGANAGSHDGVWECPDLFPLAVDDDENNQKWVMFVSIGDDPKGKEGSRTQYFVGQFDGTTFTNENSDETVLWLDYGRDNYAGVSWSDIPASDGRRIYIGWMSNWRYANLVPTKTWRSAMTLPRELSLTATDDGVRLVQKPISEIGKIRKSSRVQEGLNIDESSPISIELNNELTELELEIEQKTAATFDLIVEHSEDEKTIITCDFANGALLVDRTNSGDNSFSESFPTVQEAPLKMNSEGKLKLQLFLDTSSIEVFANDGEVAMTSLIFPSKIGEKLHLVSNNGETKISTMKVSKLNSIYE